MNIRVPFFMHDLGEAELSQVKNVLKGPILTTGEAVASFEGSFASYLGVRNALGVSSCTAGLHLALKALGVGPGDEVITTPLTFIATSTAIMECGARPVFVDVEPSTGNLDAALVEGALTERTKAILPVHLYGLLCDMRALRTLADRHRLALVEDAAHCVEGVRDDVRPGQLGDAAAFSFFATKNLSCGEGGAVVCNDGALADRMRLLRTHGMNRTSEDRFRDGYSHWDMTALGLKCNMSNIQAALLLPQLERLESKMKLREALWARYEERLTGLKGLQLPSTAPASRHGRHLFTVWVASGRRDSVIAGLQSRGIPVAVNYRAIHLLTYFRSSLGYGEGSFPEAERIGASTITLPFYPTMPPEHVDAVCDAIREVLHG